MARAKVILLSKVSEFIPRADGLAVVAAKNPIAKGGAEFLGDRSFILNGQIGNTAPGVEFIGPRKGVGGTHF